MRKWLLLCGLVALVGCEDDPPPPPANTAAPPAPTPPPMLTAPPLEPISPLGRRDGPTLEKKTMKVYRAEVCYFGSLGVPYARETYWSSIGSDDPSPINVPSFGDYPEHKPRKAGGRIPLAAKMGRLPFEHYLRACTSAKSLAKGEFEELDEALAAFDAVTSVAVRTLGDAARYYAREEYRRDDFKKGRELHQKLSDELAKFEEAHAAYGKVYRAWIAEVKPVKEAAQLDAAGKVSAKALQAARAVALRLVDKEAAPPDDLAKLLAPVRKQLDALGKEQGKDRKAPHVRLVTPKLEAFIEAVEAHGASKLDEESRYRIGKAFAAVVDADQRALALLIGGDDPFGAMGRPRLPELTPLVGRKKKKPAPAKPIAPTGTAAPK